MNIQLENKWTESICERLREEKNIDLNRYSISALEKLPYKVSIESYNINGEFQANYMCYEVDLLIKEKMDNKYIPRLIIEAKYGKVTTHDAITYSNKAKEHKDIHLGLRYGIMIANMGERKIPARLLQHGENFDFMITFSSEEPNDKEWSSFVEVINKNLEYASEIESIMKDRRSKSRKQYYCLEKDLKFYS